MGADLYLMSVFEPNHQKHRASFEEWVRRRDELKAAGKEEEAQAAQEKVGECYDQMYERGYFRDSYNASNLLSLFGVSWWGDVLDMLDDEGKLSPAYTKTCLRMLADREADFEKNLAKMPVWEGTTKAEMETYFRKKYARFKAFLEEAMALNEAIVCSI